jgi:hypothetical protein
MEHTDLGTFRGSALHSHFESKGVFYDMATSDHWDNGSVLFSFVFRLKVRMVHHSPRLETSASLS